MRSTKDSPQGSDSTIADVAAAVGVSIRTVSRVLNLSPKVNAETRERVQQAIAALNFRPSMRARAFAMGRSFLIGMVHNDRNALVLDAVQRGIVGEAGRRGYELVVHPTPMDAAASVEDVLQFVRRSRTDGLVVLPPVSGIAGLPEALAREHIPAVALSALPITGYADVILSPEREAAAQVARYLLDLGHRRIAMVGGPANAISAQERRAGFVEALAAAGVTLLDEAEGDYGFQSGLAAAERFLSLPTAPTAIFAANDVMAAGVLKCAGIKGIAVPQSLSVVGFDGSLLSHVVSPALTTIWRPFGDMARIATQQLIDRIEGQAVTAELPPPLRLVEAESSGPAPA